MSFNWGPLIQAGATIAEGLLAQDSVDQQNAQSRENLILSLQDNERARAAQEERLRLSNAASLQAANISANATIQAGKNRILGDVLLDQGKGQENLMLESFRASANAPERFNNAASVLASILSR